MDIVGMGVDLADIARIRRLLIKDPERFRARCFTEHEWSYAHRFKDPAQRLAARFAGKEAVMKSLGVGWRHVPWRDIEITGGGAPQVRLSGKAAQRAASLGVDKVLVTITHTHQQALVLALSLADGG
jgi:holo-[acyl-carrier protein] synthase